MRLNRYIALSGYCSRRKADELILEHKVEVNNVIVDTLGYQVEKDDVVSIERKKLFLPQNFIYLVMNKPTGVITTKEDPQGRVTVQDILLQSKQKRFSVALPVGRLDRDTTGTLLLTNDGELLHFLTHPSKEIPKIYQVVLKENFSLDAIAKLRRGLHLEDGFIKPDLVEYSRVVSNLKNSRNPNTKNNRVNKKKITIKLHSGKNRIIRRMMRELGAHILKLHRASFAGLTARGLSPGQFRELNHDEIEMLKSLQNNQKPIEIKKIKKFKKTKIYKKTSK